ncbi:MAG: peptide deformylase [Alphaproteobacteria bacterium]|nr:peptide deformylase [Alphaproteobacteria bacterium]
MFNVPQISQVGDPVLRAKAAAVEARDIGTDEFKRLVEAMTGAMRAGGVGLAAPQIGASLQVVVMEDPAEYSAKMPEAERLEKEREPFALKVMINPVLREVGTETRDFFEGCLSIRGYTAMVRRHREVSVSYLDETGTPQTWRPRGWAARIVQHEYDHLHGVLYTDRMDPQSFMTDEEYRKRYLGMPIAALKEKLGLM